MGSGDNGKREMGNNKSGNSSKSFAMKGKSMMAAEMEVFFV